MLAWVLSYDGKGFWLLQTESCCGSPENFRTNFAGAKSQKSRKVAGDDVGQDTEVQNTSSGSS